MFSVGRFVRCCAGSVQALVWDFYLFLVHQAEKSALAQKGNKHLGSAGGHFSRISSAKVILGLFFSGSSKTQWEGMRL